MNQTLAELFKFVLIGGVALAVTAPIFPVTVSEISDTQMHLVEFSKYASTHHDNIDDTSVSHSHIHKHSEEGEEHEHDHQHSRVSYSAFQTMIVFKAFPMNFRENKAILVFSEKNFISNPQTFDIFRPPRG